MNALQAQAILRNLAESDLRGPALRVQAMKFLSELPGFDWSGIYRLEGAELVLDAFVGAHTDHVRIPVGRGVCGTAVSENRNQIVSDVRELSNYLSCSAFTRSEIVVLIRSRAGEILGQIDIDGHEVGAFGDQEEQFLTDLANILSERWT